MSTSTYQKIIDRTITLFLEKGFHSTSMDNIADAAGIKKPSLYYHFSNKETLVLAVIASIHNYFEQKIFIHDSVKAADKLRGPDYLPNLIHEHLRKAPQTRLLTQLAIEIREEHPTLLEKIRQHFIACIEHIANQLGMETEKAKRFAKLALSELLGSVLLSILFKDDNFLMEQDRLYKLSLQEPPL